jgi:hypothetical protein
MMRMGTNSRKSRAIAASLLAAGLAGAGLALVLPSLAAAQVEDTAPIKAYWQERYRALRLEEAQLVKTVELATKEYADSNRRTYRRSGVRHFHRTNAEDARVRLVEVREQISALPDQLREAGGYQSWLDEVDDEPIDMNRIEGLGVYADDGEFGGKGAYAADGDDAEGGTDAEDADPTEDDGRNPLYTDGSDESSDGEALDGAPASADAEAGSRPDFDYESWRRNRSEYESKRAAETQLVPEASDDVELEEQVDPN